MKSRGVFRVIGIITIHTCTCLVFFSDLCIYLFRFNTRIRYFAWHDSKVLGSVFSFSSDQMYNITRRYYLPFSLLKNMDQALPAKFRYLCIWFVYIHSSFMERKQYHSFSRSKSNRN